MNAAKSVKGSVKRRIRHSRDYREFKWAVLERDFYTCRACGKVGGRIEVHHIISVSNRPDLMLDPDNAVSLCRNCHRKEHGYNVENSH